MVTIDEPEITSGGQVVASDSGRIVILEYDGTKNMPLSWVAGQGCGRDQRTSLTDRTPWDIYICINMYIYICK